MFTGKPIHLYKDFDSIKRGLLECLIPLQDGDYVPVLIAIPAIVVGYYSYLRHATCLIAPLYGGKGEAVFGLLKIVSTLYPTLTNRKTCYFLPKGTYNLVYTEVYTKKNNKWKLVNLHTCSDY
jgi:hypothetical protein